ncbi:hypothetical protein [Micromonospora zamorensis]|uniref:Uncharacterized protein n=1 Tax=Micromonospora zamorensis TaxID=709883 RepID=A0ABZ1PN31_9ACTN
MLDPDHVVSGFSTNDYLDAEPAPAARAGLLAAQQTRRLPVRAQLAVRSPLAPRHPPV